MGTISPVEGDGLLHPRGPLPSEVYWRRRLIVLGVVVLALVFLVAQCSGGGKAGDTTKASSTASKSTGPAPKSPTKSAAKPTAKSSTQASAAAPTKAAVSKATVPAPVTSSPAASPSAAAPAPCKGLQASVKANATRYSAGINPVITLSIKNPGATACARDISAAATELKITSGSDRIWSSDDCSKPGPGKLTVLKPGEIRTVPVSWNRKRSKTGTDCVGADAKIGQYKVVGRVGDLTTFADQFALSP